MRGARDVHPQRADCLGIIPADAGSTAHSGGFFHAKKDHPRGCGEHVLYGHVGINPLGSSPRMRGAL